MDYLDDYIETISYKLPILASTKDLKKIGLYRSDQAAAAARRKGMGPPFFKINARVILYPREGVIEYLKNSKCKLRENKYDS